MRQQAVKALGEGQTVRSVAVAYGVNEHSFFRWLADFAHGGQNALLAKPIPGRPSKLSAEEISWIAKAVRDHNPQQFKFEFGLWTLSLIRHLIQRQFKKELSVSSVHRLMKILGFSAQKPLYQAWQQDPGRVRTWETETYPAIRAEAKRVGASIYFGDDIRSDNHTGTTWAPQGQRQVVQATGQCPYCIIKMLDLIQPIYQKTAAYGHFGREEPEFSWERTDRAEALREAAGL